MFALIRTFEFLDKDNFTPLYKSLVRTHLDYASSVWAPYNAKLIDKIEGVQKCITKQLPGMQNLDCPERLKKLKLPTLAYCRIRGDMIETYKMINSLYDQRACSLLKLTRDTELRTSKRGNNKKVMTQRFGCDLRKNSFSVRISKVWNSLPK